MLNGLRRNLILITLLFFGMSIQAQESGAGKNVLSLNLFKYEKNSLTINNRMEPKFVNGISYERKFSKWSWISTVEYGENLINDNCNQCADHYYGVGQLKEFNFYSGYNYTFNENKSSKFKWFVGTDAYFSLMNYSGRFGGGLSGSGVSFNTNYLIIGGLQRVGVSYYPIPRLRITLISSFRFGAGWRQTVNFQSSLNKTIKSTEASSTAAHLKIGFLF